MVNNSNQIASPNQTLISVLDKMDIGMALLDQQGKIQWSNQHMDLWFPSTSEFIQDPCGYLCQQDQPPHCILHATKSGEKTSCEYVEVQKDGERKFYLISVYPLNVLPDSEYQLLLLVHDVTEQKLEALEAQRTMLLQEAIYQIAAASTSVDSLEDMYAALHTIIRKIMPADNFYIALQDQSGTEIYFPYFADERDPGPSTSLPIDDKSISGHVLRTGKSLLCTKKVSAQLAQQGKVDLYGPEPEIWLGVPLIIDDKPIGVMAVQHYTDPEAYTERELKLFEFVSAEVAKAIQAKRGEEALLQAERRFRNIVEEAPMGFHQYMLTSEGELIFIFSNKTGNNFLRSNSKQSLGLPIEQAFPLLSEADLPNIYREIAIKGGAHQSKVTRTDNGRTEATYELFAFQTVPNQMAILIQDITERMHTEKALIENEKRIRNIIEASPLGLLIYHLTTSGNLIMVEANPSASEILNLDCQELLGETLEEAFPSTENTNIPVLFRDLARQGGTFSVQQFTYKTEDLESAYETYAFQISPNRIAIMFQDVTDRLEQEMKIKELNESLEERVRQRTGELEAFAYSVSHDLRAPVRAIRGFTEMISQDTKNQFSPESGDLLARVLDASRKMDELINDLLSLSHLGSTQINILPVNLSEVTREIKEKLIAEVPDEKVTIRIDDTPDIYADRSLMEIMLTNLMTNAIKFSRDNPNPAIHFGSSRHGNRVEFFLQDNGIGFEMEYHRKIFHPFERLNPTEYEGTGIGLAIVQRVIQQHNGEIWASSTPGEGTTFFFTIPQSPA